MDLHKNCLAAMACLCVLASSATAAEWVQFRGPDGAGISKESSVPTTWDADKDVVWKTKLPGAGSSSPIIMNGRVFVTSYSDYGTDESSGSLTDMKRHLICLDQKTGKILWDSTVDVETPEDDYQGFLREHGYASNTPTTDGERIYVHFGKSGAYAFDWDGKEVWKFDLGKESSGPRWGSAASPILYKNMVILNASEESKKLYALDRETGKEIWNANLYNQCYSTPTIVQNERGEDEMILPVPNEVWSFNPETGKLRWFCETSLGGNISPTTQHHDGIVYIFGGRGDSGSIAIRTGGKKDITKTHVVWESRNSSYVATPILHDGYLYWIDDNGLANCSDAATGEEKYRKRLKTAGNRPFYASLVMAGDNLFGVSRRSGVYVLAAKPEFELVATNDLGDKSEFNATPAIVGDQMFLRSDNYIYCIGSGSDSKEKTEKTKGDD